MIKKTIHVDFDKNTGSWRFSSDGGTTWTANACPKVTVHVGWEEDASGARKERGEEYRIEYRLVPHDVEFADPPLRFAKHAQTRPCAPDPDCKNRDDFYQGNWWAKAHRPQRAGLFGWLGRKRKVTFKIDSRGIDNGEKSEGQVHCYAIWVQWSGGAAGFDPEVEEDYYGGTT